MTLAKNALKKAESAAYDVLIVDCGRLGIDEAMMNEISGLHRVLSPIETLFVVDSMTGQDAANTAKAFLTCYRLPGLSLQRLTVTPEEVLLSVSSITGQPIKFMGVGGR